MIINLAREYNWEIGMTIHSRLHKLHWVVSCPNLPVEGGYGDETMDWGDWEIYRDG